MSTPRSLADAARPAMGPAAVAARSPLPPLTPPGRVGRRMVALPSGPRFVGREKELQRLERGLEEAAAGRPELFVMGGEAGVGKTRVVEEFVARAAGTGATALVGGCIDVEERGLPLGPFVEAMRDYTRGLDDERRRQLGGAALGPLLPDLGEPAAGPARAIGASQGRLFELALGLLGRI
ncbi:MAG: hypothetical protein QOI10_4147, partial [Solirubrobacterales bacterium]|nr:hypothetical protein [Solirubrobacterales bacterium]